MGIMSEIVSLVDACSEIKRAFFMVKLKAACDSSLIQQEWEGIVNPYLVISSVPLKSRNVVHKEARNSGTETAMMYIFLLIAINHPASGGLFWNSNLAYGSFNMEIKGKLFDPFSYLGVFGGENTREIERILIKTFSPNCSLQFGDNGELHPPPPCPPFFFKSKPMVSTIL